MRSTIDMYFAACYIAYGGKLDKVDRSDMNKQRFYLKDESVDFVWVLDDMDEAIRMENPTYDDIETAYISKTLMFPPNFPEGIRTIKTAIYAGK